jgi:hypothetical protein
LLLLLLLLLGLQKQLLCIHIIVIILAEQIQPKPKVWARLVQYSTAMLAALAALVPAILLVLAPLPPVLPLPGLSLWQFLQGRSNVVRWPFTTCCRKPDSWFELQVNVGPSCTDPYPGRSTIAIVYS